MNRIIAVLTDDNWKMTGAVIEIDGQRVKVSKETLLENKDTAKFSNAIIDVNGNIRGKHGGIPRIKDSKNSPLLQLYNTGAKPLLWVGATTADGSNIIVNSSNGSSQSFSMKDLYKFIETNKLHIAGAFPLDYNELKLDIIFPGKISDSLDHLIHTHLKTKGNYSYYKLFNHIASLPIHTTIMIEATINLSKQNILRLKYTDGKINIIDEFRKTSWDEWAYNTSQNEIMQRAKGEITTIYGNWEVLEPIIKTCSCAENFLVSEA